MKNTMNRALRGMLALALSCCLLFGMVGAVFAEETQQDELNQILSDIQGLMMKYGPQIPAEVQNGTYKGTRTEYEPGENSYYVAIGDDSVRKTSSDTYASLLAKEYGLDEEHYEILAKKKLLIEAAGAEIITPNEAEIRKADLVSLGFSINGFALVAVDEVLGKNEPSYLDWSLYLPAEGVAEVEATLARLKQYLKDTGVDKEYSLPFLKLNVADTLVAAAESFAFGTMAYAHSLPKVIDQIHSINPDATVVIVGMDNPLDGSSVKLSSGEIMDLGSYVDKLIGYTGDIAQTVAIEKNNTVFVAAPDAANENDGKVLADTDLLLTYTQYLARALPNAEGHEYIKKCILSAKRPVGDADNNGTVNYKDAMLVLRASIQLEQVDEETVRICDVDKNGVLTYKDAMSILRASIGLEELG